MSKIDPKTVEWWNKVASAEAQCPEECNIWPACCLIRDSCPKEEEQIMKLELPEHVIKRLDLIKHKDETYIAVINALAIARLNKLQGKYLIFRRDCIHLKRLYGATLKFDHCEHPDGTLCTFEDCPIRATKTTRTFEGTVDDWMDGSIFLRDEQDKEDWGFQEYLGSLKKKKVIITIGVLE